MKALPLPRQWIITLKIHQSKVKKLKGETKIELDNSLFSNLIINFIRMTCTLHLIYYLHSLPTSSQFGLQCVDQRHHLFIPRAMNEFLRFDSGIMRRRSGSTSLTALKDNRQTGPNPRHNSIRRFHSPPSSLHPSIVSPVPNTATTTAISPTKPDFTSEAL